MAKAPFLDPALIEQSYNTRNFEGYVYYLQEYYGIEKANKIIDSIGLPSEYLLKKSNWVSEEYADRFYKIIRSLPDIQPDFSYQVAKYSFKRSIQDPIHTLGLRLLDPSNVFKQIESFASKYNKVDQIKIENITSNQAKFKFKSRRKTPHFDLIVSNWIGMLEIIPTGFGLPSAKCDAIHHDDQTVSFEVSWKSNSRYTLLNRVIILLVLLILFETILLSTKFLAHVFVSISYLLILNLIFFEAFLAAVCAYLTQIQSFQFFDKSSESLNIVIRETEEKYKELYDSKVKIDRRYRESHLLAGVLQRISSSSNVRELTQNTVSEIQQSLKYDRVIYLYYNEFDNTLETFTHAGFSGPQEKQVNSYKINLNEKTESQFHLGNIFKEKTNILVPVTEGYFKSLSLEGQAMIKTLESKSFLVCSVFTENSCHGLLLVDYYKQSKILNQDDLYFINNIAKQLAICLDNIKILEKEKKLRSSFQRFVPDKVIEAIMDDENVTINSGLMRPITVMFSDIRNFTGITEKTESGLLVRALNYYFQNMNRIIYKHGGLVDKFIGDAILATFNVFGDLPDHNRIAVQVAIEMQNSMNEINNFIRERIFKGNTGPIFRIGIGIHTGNAIVGNLGSNQKMEYTAIGSTVNIAQRVESETRHFGDAVLISEDLARNLKAYFKLESVGKRALKGIQEPKELYLVNWRESQGNIEEVSDLSERKEAA